MASVTGITAARALAIEAASVVGAKVVNGNLILLKPEGIEINVGPVGGGGGGSFSNVAAVTVTSPDVARPDALIVFFIGGTVRPTRLGPLDIWFSEGAPVPTAPTIDSTPLTSMVVGAAFNQTLVVTGDRPLSFAVTTGSLPAGLSLAASTGVISGTPSAAGNYSFTITATNSAGSDGQAYSGTVAAAGVAPALTTTTIASMTQNVAYTQALAATGSTPRTWGISAGALPSGLAINSSTGALSGTPTVSGAYNFTVQVSNAFGQATRQFTGSISANVVAPTITTTTLGTLTQGTTASITLAVTGSTPITFAVTTGTLPAGLTLNASTGQITGTPSASGAYNFTVTATNSAGNDTQVFSGTVGTVAVTPPTITTTALNSLTQGSSFSQTIAATGGLPITWAVLSGSLPAGLSLASSTGIISGTPTAAGSYSFVLRATNSGGVDDQAFSGAVAAPSAGVSVFGTTALTGLVSGTDASSGSWTAHQFYVPGAQPAISKILGARIFIQDGSSQIGQTWRAAVQRIPDHITTGANQTALSTQIDAFNNNGTRTEGDVLVAGWNQLLFATEQDGIPPAGAWWIGVQIGNGTRYQSQSRDSIGPNFVPAPGNRFVLAERGEGVAGEAFRKTYNGAMNAFGDSYGIDTLVRL